MYQMIPCVFNVGHVWCMQYDVWCRLYNTTLTNDKTISLFSAPRCTPPIPPVANTWTSYRILWDSKNGSVQLTSIPAWAAAHIVAATVVPPTDPCKVSLRWAIQFLILSELSTMQSMDTLRRDGVRVTVSQRGWVEPRVLFLSVQVYGHLQPLDWGLL